MTRQYSFYYHYNKPLSASVGRPQLSIHYRGKCYIVDEIECKVNTKSRVRKTQPRMVICGKGTLNIDGRKGILE